MPVHVRRHLNRSVAEPRLHHLERQFEPAINAAVYAPRRIEVAQAVQALVLGLAVSIDDTGRDLGWVKCALDDAAAVVEAAETVREAEVVLVLAAGDFDLVLP